MTAAGLAVAGVGALLAASGIARATAGSADYGPPVVDSSGDVAGVVFARSSERDGVAYAVDAAALASFLR